MASQSLGIVRAAAFLSSALILAKASSIGLKHVPAKAGIGTVGRQEQQDGAGRLYGLADGDGLVGRQVVHHHDIAAAQRRRQDLLDIGEKGRAGHGAVERHRRDHTRKRQAADERRCLPVTVGNRRPAALALERTAIHPRHLGRGSTLVDEDQALRIEVRLGGEPGTSATCYVRAVLLGRVRRLFLRVTPWRLKNVCTTLGGGR